VKSEKYLRREERQEKNEGRKIRYSFINDRYSSVELITICALV
jgi:hypothetical protein